MYILSFMDSVNSFIKSIKDFFYDNYNNPFLWVGIVGGVLLIFGIAYNALHKGE